MGKKIVILGNGISGITAARHIRKQDDACEILVISAETEYFFSRTALMYVYMGHMQFEHTKPYEDWFWKKNRIDLLQAYIQVVDFESKLLKTSNGEEVAYDSLILAVGSKPNKFNWPGQDLHGVQGLYSYQDLQLLEKNTKNVNRAVIVGGGLIGVELAEMLKSRGLAVTFLIRENRFWGNVLPEEEGELVMNHLRDHGVELLLNTELKEILDDGNGRVNSIITSDDKVLDCQFVGLTAGVTPNVDFLRNSALQINRGIVVDELLQTNITDVYAVGDCAEHRNPKNGRKSIEQVWYTGRIMGETVAQTICGNPQEYLPGNWFNSAKFFDIEYQTYGVVNAILPNDEATYYWEHDNGRKCLRLVFKKDSHQFIGVNVFGIRLRHHVLDGWLNEKKSVEYVLEHLRDANFDPELYQSFEKEIIAKFNNENNTNLKVKRKDWNRLLNWMSKV